MTFKHSTHDEKYPTQEPPRISVEDAPSPWNHWVLNQGIYFYIIICFLLFLAARSIAQTSNCGTLIPGENGVAYVDATVNGLSQQMLPSTSGTLQLFTHGRPGQLLIQGEWKSPVAIAAWLQHNYSPNDYRHINVYGCEFAKGQKGMTAVQYLEQQLGTTVAASTNVTGRDGDWVLEVGPSSDALSFLDYKGNLQCTYGQYTEPVTVSWLSNDNLDGYTGVSENTANSTGGKLYSDGANVKYTSSGGFHAGDSILIIGNYQNDSRRGPLVLSSSGGGTFNSGAVFNNAFPVNAWGTVVYVIPSGTAQFSTLNITGETNNGVYVNIDAVSIRRTYCYTCNVNVAPVMSASSVSNTCPAQTYNLTSITAANTPAGTVLTWHTGTPATNGNKITNIAAASGSAFYAAFYHTANGCYSGISGTATTRIEATGDADCDGIANTSDIDDDNDGVLDIDEQQCASTSLSKIGIVLTKPSTINFTFDGSQTLANLIDGTDANDYIIYAPTGTLSNAEWFRIELPTAKILTSWEIGHYSGQTLFSTSSTYKIQGSNDASNWTDLTGTLTYTNNQTGYSSQNSSNIATFSQNTTAFKFYRYYGISGASGGTWATEFYFNEKVCADINTDGDGTANRLDLDSDGDGCSDAKEAGATTSTASNYQFTGADANNNGLVDSKENGTTAAINYTSTYNMFALKASLNACTDADNDGIGDLVDRDDDNDGVLDVTESTGNCGYFGGDNFTALTFAGSSSVIINAPKADSIIVSGNGSWNSKYSDKNYSLPVYFEFTLSSVASENMIGLIPSAGTQTTTNWNDAGYKFYFSNATAFDVRLNGSTGTAGTYANGDKFSITIDAAGNLKMYKNGVLHHTQSVTVSQYKLTISSASTTARPYYNIILNEQSNLYYTCGDRDTDGDSTPNRLDLDSDGDGCSDAKEAGATTSTTANYQFSTTPDANGNGLNDAKETGTTGTINYISYYGEYALSTAFNACADTDGDGIGDLIDIDDDNDGILDETEMTCGTPTVSKTGVSVSTAGVTYSYNGSNTIANLVDGTDNNNHVIYNPTGTLNNAPWLVVTFPSKKKLTYWEIGHYNGQTLFSTSSTYKIQGSNDNSTWVDVTGTLTYNNSTTSTSGGLSTYNSNIANITNTDVAYQYYRMYGISGSSGGGWATELYFKEKVCTDLNADSDGTANRLDLDSDGDGCSDAKEAGATISTTTNYQFATTPDANGNGLNDTKETGTSGAINYYSTYSPYATSSFLSACADMDADGIADLFDIDDDNDGSLDATEAASCYYTATEAVTSIKVSTGMTSTVNSVSVTTGTDVSTMHNGTSTSVAAENHVFTASQAMAGANIYTIELSTAANLSSVSVTTATASWGTSSTATLKGSNDLTNWQTLMSTPLNTTTGTTKTFTVNQNAAEYRYYRIEGVATATSASFTNYEVTATLNTATYNQSVHPKATCSVDTDGDGTPNNRDLDSDGDGCSDAKEAKATTNSTTNFQFSGTDANSNGLVDSKEHGTTGTINYTSTYVLYATSSTLNGCIDSDNDSIGDLIDIDDDNDGVPDALESPTCYFTEVEMATIQSVTTDFGTYNTTSWGIQNTIDASTTTAVQYNLETSVNKAYLTVTLSTFAPIEFLELQMGEYGLSQSETSNTMMLQGFDGNVWLDLEGAPAARTLANGSQFILNTKQMATKFNKLRLLGISGDAYYGRIQNAKISIGVFNASAYPRPACTGNDFDNDGTANHLDLDSDNDGCPDATEAGATNSSNASFKFTGADLNGDGLVNTVDPNHDGIVNYTLKYTTYALSATIAACQDTDNDGIFNHNDCSPTNAALPTVPGTTCNDGDANTVNDVYQGDGCTCRGVNIITGCADPVVQANVDCWANETVVCIPCTDPSIASVWKLTSGTGDCATQFPHFFANLPGSVGNEVYFFMRTDNTAFLKGNFTYNNKKYIVYVEYSGYGNTSGITCSGYQNNKFWYATVSGFYKNCETGTKQTFNTPEHIHNGYNSTSTILALEGWYSVGAGVWFFEKVSEGLPGLGHCTPCYTQGGDTDEDGVCNATDCKPFDATLPATPGSTCNDGNANTTNDLITADGCGCAGTVVPCAGQGGDSDGDGVCNNTDCEPNNPAIPATPGIPCNDGNSNTVNDVVTADGCGCAGTPVPCAYNGGDTDGDGVCDDEDCEPNDHAVPTTPGIPCNDGNPNTTNDVVTADGCGCIGTPTGPCAYNGGDTDGDGVCNDTDCAPNNPAIPATPGTPCNDGNANTTNDVVTADGCGCAGTTPPICNNVTNGGTIGFGTSCSATTTVCNQPVPALLNCASPSGGAGDFEIVWLKAINNPNCYPPTTSLANMANDPYWSIIPGETSLSLTNPGTITQHTCYLRCVRRAGCSVMVESNIASVDIDPNCVAAPNCSNITITPGSTGITVNGLNGAPITSLQVFSQTWQQQYNCFATCGASQTVALSSGTYYVYAKYYTAGYQLICEKQETVTVSAGNGNGPCANAGGDTDGDGTCNNTDCQPNNPAYPATPGTACNDNNASTTNDVVTADGCACAGTIPSGPCANAGGDTDGDGTCNNTDCQPSNPAFPATPGTACNDNNANTTNDVVTADGCGCAGTATGGGGTPNCSNITITPGSTGITVGGLDGAPISSLQVFSQTWQQQYNCFANCGASQTVALPSGTYYVYAKYYTSGYQLICEKQETVTVSAGTGPCANAGGDTDGDGVCNNTDCQPSNPAFPATPGTACNDGNANTTNDVVTADGCGCAGTIPSGPCANAGGDSDGDGTCNNTDCQPNNPAFPATPGTACNDGNANTTNDVVTADGCGCAGTATGGGTPNCSTGITITSNSTGITVSGLGGAPVSSLQVLNQSWQQQYSCFANCGATQTVALPSGTYYVYAKYYTASYHLICEKQETVTVSAGSGGGPCANAGGDSDGDGTCNNTDCQPTNPAFPATPGTPCNDSNANTVNDVVTADGCGCAGTASNMSDCANIHITTDIGHITVTGLDGAPVSSLQVFNSNWGTEFSCFSNCGASKTLNVSAGSYYVYAKYYSANYGLICEVTETVHVPVVLGSNQGDRFQFEAVKQEEHTELFWMHNGGKSVEEYILEKSLDGVAFEQLDNLPSIGRNSEELYQTTDFEPATGDNYYRVKMVGIDGSVAYSDIETVNFPDLIDFTLFPNPANDFVKVNLESVVGQQDVSITVFNNLGVEVKRFELDEVYSKYYLMEVRDIKEGFYIVWLNVLGKRPIAKTLMIGDL